MRYVYIVILGQRWEALQDIVRDSNKFGASRQRSMFQVRTYNIEQSGFREFGMTSDRTEKISITLVRLKFCQRKFTGTVPGSENIHNMISLDPTNAFSSSQPRKRNENIVGQRHNVAVSVYKRRLVLRLFRIGDGHQQRRFHINSTVEVKDSRQAILDRLIERGVLGEFGFEVVYECSRRARGLFEKCCEGSLVVGGIRFGFEDIN